MYQKYKLFMFKAKHKNMCFMIHEILKYENIFYFDGEDWKTI